MNDSACVWAQNGVSGGCQVSRRRQLEYNASLTTCRTSSPSSLLRIKRSMLSPTALRLVVLPLFESRGLLHVVKYWMSNWSVPLEPCPPTVGLLRVSSPTSDTSERCRLTPILQVATFHFDQRTVRDPTRPSSPLSNIHR